MIHRALLPLAAAACTAAAAACARQGAPSGGPQDRRPPVIVEVRPDTFARIDAGDASIRIQFDEAISESPSSGTLDQAVQISPRTGAIDVSHGGDALEVKIEGGLRPGVLYRVTVLPVVQDRFRNTMLDPFEWVFSTGPDFAPNALAGEVWDRVTGDPVPAMDVFAVSPDSVRYVARTDSLGLFVMRYLPPGSYGIRSFDDRNANDSADAFEVQGVGDPVTLGPADTTLTSFWVMLPDTTPPQLARGEKIDSTTLRLIFDDPLDPEQPLDGVVRGMYRDSGDTPGVLRALHPWRYELYLDSVAAMREAEAALAPPDPAVPVPAAPDTAAAADTAAVDTAQAAEPEADAVEAAFLPNGERVPEREIVLLLRGPIEGGSAYTVVLGPVSNISGLVSEEGEGVIRLPADPEPPAADTTAVPDTAGVVLPPPDTMRLGRR